MKKILFIILSVTLLIISATFVVFSKGIINKNAPDPTRSKTSDEVSEWAKAEIDSAKDAGILTGDENYVFSDNITREEFCELIYNYYKLMPQKVASSYDGANFIDTDNEHIEELRKIGIIKGKTQTQFCPDDFLTREESAVFLLRLIKNVHPDWAAHELYFEFSDSQNISEWAMNDIQVICNMGIMNGTGNGKFAPKDNLTAEQAIATLTRIYNNFNDNYKNAENMTYEDMKKLQDSVNNGHFPWRLDCKQVMAEFISAKGESIENGELISFLENDEKCNGDFKVGENIYKIELFKPIDKSANGVWVVKTCEKSEVIGGGDAKTEIVVSDLSFDDKLNLNMPKDKNYMFSPFSVKSALALAANGADGKTKDEILNALEINDIDEFNGILKTLIENYSQTDVLKLDIANSIWINSDKTAQKFEDEFKKIATEYYKSEVKNVYNANAVNEINLWVSKKTNGKIPQIINSTDDFEAMLINAIYFKAAWKNVFNQSATKPDKFIGADGKETQIDFMNQTGWFDFAKTNTVQIINLPYNNNADKFSDKGEYIGTEVYDSINISMYLIAANDNIGDINVASELKKAIADKKFESTYVSLGMPKFKIEYSENLSDALKKIGIKTAFEKNSAQFQKMFDFGNMRFSDIFHKTFIEVDENGTEAAAVTAIAMETLSLPPKPLNVKFDKPFYFAICDNLSGEILFMGRYAYAE